MLRTLTIRNAALIESAEIEFAEGLNVLSGETGAGKSVVLDCIDFVLGAKADKSMVRHGADACDVRAEFSCSDPVRKALADLDLEADDTVLITRRLTSDGRSSLRVNGCSVTVAMLRRITSLLVDLHGQSEHFFLLKESNQLRLLDSIAGEPVAAVKASLRRLLDKRKDILASLELLGGDEGERGRRLDILRYQIDEIERADLKEGEEEELLSLRERFRNAEKIAQGLSAAREFLLADGGCTDALRGAIRSLSPISRFSEEYAALLSRMESAEAELSDVADTVDSLAEELELDERETERVEARLDEIKSIKKKYGGSLSEVLAFHARACEEYALLSDSGEKFARLSAELKQVEGEIFKVCTELSAARKQAAGSFERRVIGELATLNIPSARFEVQFDEFTREDAPRATAEGLGGVRFLFSANAGEPPKELGKIISGGEMSRFMLAVKAQLSEIGEIGTYVFDEIDAGIGGKTARVVAEKFCNIARSVQVVAVTHSAQIAAFADRSFSIEKHEDGGRTRTTIREIAGEDAVKEIARLLDATGSELSLEHARELKTAAQTYKNSHR